MDVDEHPAADVVKHGIDPIGDGEPTSAVEQSGTKSARNSNDNNNSSAPLDNVKADANAASNKESKSTDPSSNKKSRKRKKHIYNDIRQTMEFYFSDANLSKDRFLMRLIEKDPEVPLAVFMTFNKIKSMVSSVEEIEKALSSSEKLRLSADRTKIARRTVFVPLETRCPDDLTIYVEALPTTATHDWVRQIFEPYGAVAYVSLPKYRTSRRIKEFAFVEFEQRAAVLRAMTAFAAMGCALNAASDPEKLASILAYLREQEEENCGAQLDGDKKLENKSGKPNVKPKSKASRNAPTLVATEDEPEQKRARTEAGDDEMAATPLCADTTASMDTGECAVASAKGDESNDVKVDGVEVEDDAAEDDNNDENPSNDSNKTAKVHRKKTTAKLNDSKSPVVVRMDISATSLRITTRLEWKKLRNKYLGQQRDRVKQMKKQLWLSRRQGGGGGGAPDATEDELHKPSGNINFYNANKKQHALVDGESAANQPLFAKRSDNAGVEGGAESQSAKEAKDGTDAPAVATASVTKAPTYSYEPGIIVQVTFEQSCVNVKDFKAEMRQHACVRYVDVKEGDLSAFVRIDASASAADLIAKVAPLRCEVLNGAVEETYWQKIDSDRKQKLGKELKLKPRRGREKVKAVAAALQVNHVRFED